MDGEEEMREGVEERTEGGRESPMDTTGASELSSSEFCDKDGRIVRRMFLGEQRAAATAKSERALRSEEMWWTSLRGRASVNPGCARSNSSGLSKRLEKVIPAAAMLRIGL